MTCPNHPDLPPQALEPIRGTGCEENFAICGCWRYPPMLTFKRHAFRFFRGDRVQWGQFAGVTGTVDSDLGSMMRPYVRWDAHCKDWAPTAFPSNFEIRHIGD